MAWILILEYILKKKNISYGKIFLDKIPKN